MYTCPVSVLVSVILVRGTQNEREQERGDQSPLEHPFCGKNARLESTRTLTATVRVVTCSRTTVPQRDATTYLSDFDKLQVAYEPMRVYTGTKMLPPLASS